MFENNLWTMNQLADLLQNTIQGDKRFTLG